MKRKLFSFAMALAVLAGLCAGIPSTANAASTNSAGGEEVSWSGQSETGLVMFVEHTPSSGDLYGLKDANGTVVFPAEYWMFQYAGGDRIIAGRREEGVGIVTAGGAVIYPYTAAEINVCNEEDPVFRIAKMPYETASWMDLIYGLYDWDGKELLPIQYDTLRYYDDGYFVLGNDGLRGVYKQGAGTIIQPQYRNMAYLGQDLFSALKGEKFGAVNAENQQILSFAYDCVDAYAEGCFCVGQFTNEEARQHVIVKNSGQFQSWDYEELIYGIVDSSGNEVLPLKYDLIHLYEDGSGRACKWDGTYSGGIAGASGGSRNYYDVLRFTIDELLHPAPPNATGFYDVPETSWFYRDALWAVEKGITTGDGAGTFSPNKNCTNAQILTFLWRTCGRPEPSIANPFTNTIPEAYAKAAVWAYEKGMISGTTFDVDKPCTRAMTVEYIWRAAGCPTAASAAGFPDVPAGASYAQAVAWAVSSGVTTGVKKETGTIFDPDGVCNRSQIVTFLHRAYAE
ncbi:MAG: hypothetical protein HDT14_11405 [Oscillibacter sp.]|nr:hypothetical protein [Oscillibacter sp.]